MVKIKLYYLVLFLITKKSINFIQEAILESFRKSKLGVEWFLHLSLGQTRFS